MPREVAHHQPGKEGGWDKLPSLDGSLGERPLNGRPVRPGANGKGTASVENPKPSGPEATDTRARVTRGLAGGGVQAQTPTWPMSRSQALSPAGTTGRRVGGVSLERWKRWFHAWRTP